MFRACSVAAYTPLPAWTVRPEIELMRTRPATVRRTASVPASRSSKASEVSRSSRRAAGAPAEPRATRARAAAAPTPLEAP
ncbi:hypothetical protein ACFRI7_35015 [Streptomyces sp. NPDC056716]|uniref:hypothetical protein n=1 Tax=unclassified Streptomyces TaxID=2593676 RepID=UPI00367A8D62